MKEIPGFVIRSAPRTKKNSSRIITIPTKGARKCHACGHLNGFPRILPSEAYESWENEAKQQCFGIMAELRRRGVEFPITDQVSIDAQIFREKAIGDACGFYQAIGDMLQVTGIIANDAQIADWDGSRRLKDADDPRIEIFITVLSESKQEEIRL